MSPLVKAFLLFFFGVACFAVSVHVKGLWGSEAMPDCTGRLGPGVNARTMMARYEYTLMLEAAVYTFTAGSMAILIFLICPRACCRNLIRIRMGLIAICISLCVVIDTLIIITVAVHPLGCDGRWTMDTMGGYLLCMSHACCTAAALVQCLYQYSRENARLAELRECTETTPLLRDSEAAVHGGTGTDGGGRGGRRTGRRGQRVTFHPFVRGAGAAYSPRAGGRGQRVTFHPFVRGPGAAYSPRAGGRGQRVTFHPSVRGPGAAYSPRPMVGSIENVQTATV